MTDAYAEARPRRNEGRTLTARRVAREVKVSVVVPAYKAEPFIAETVESIRRQTLQDLELIVVDDASPDRTSSIVTACGLTDPRIRLITKPANEGVCVARNEGIAAAQGRWIAFVDADDWLDPSRLAVLVAAAERLRADWIADDQFVVEPSDRSAPSRVLLQEPRAAALVDLAHYIARDPPERIGYGTLKPLVRRSFLIDHPIWFRPGIERFEDFVFHVEMGLHGARMALVNQPLYFYRRHPGSLTARDPIATLVGMLKQNEVATLLAAARGAETARAALRRRNALIGRALQYRSLLACLARGDVPHVVQVLREHPNAAFHLLSGLARAAGRRLRPSTLTRIAIGAPAPQGDLRPSHHRLPVQPTRDEPRVNS